VAIQACPDVSPSARVLATGLTRDQVRALKVAEPRRGTGLIIGSPKPLALARPKSAAVTPAGNIPSTAPESLASPNWPALIGKK